MHKRLIALGLLILLLLPLVCTQFVSAEGTWVRYIPTPAQTEIIPLKAERAVVVRLTLPDGGYRVVSPGVIARSAGILPGGGTYMAFMTVGTQIERWTGISAPVITVKEIRYSNLSFGTKNRFTFRVYDVFVKALDF